jgi:hypothetical protein
MKSTAKIRVYATSFFTDDLSLFDTLLAYGFGKPSWKNIEFVTDDEFDFVVILSIPSENHKKFDSQKAITFLTEPPQWFINREICGTVSPMYLPRTWWISSKNNDIVSSLYHFKSKLLSSITSELTHYVGHYKRLQFLYNLDLSVVDGLDIYGRKDGREAVSGQIFSKFKNYRGRLDDKYDGLIPYLYHFACENSFVPGYFTEKIMDPIIAESLCFYDGCTNIEEYIDYRAFIRIDVNDILNSIEIIFKSIENDEYRKRRKYILKEKKRFLFELNPLNIIWAQLNGKDLSNYFKIK